MERLENFLTRRHCKWTRATVKVSGGRLLDTIASSDPFTGAEPSDRARLIIALITPIAPEAACENKENDKHSH